MEVQVRSEVSGIHLFTSVKDAHQYVRTDPSVWKVSFNGKRFRIKNKVEKWSDRSEQRIGELNHSYADAPSDQNFWVQQSVMFDEIHKKEFMDLYKDVAPNVHLADPFFGKMKEQLSEEKYNECLFRLNSMWATDASNHDYILITEVYTDEEFLQKFC